MNKLDTCIDCGDPLKNVRHIRTKRKLCPMCRGDRTSENTKVREIFKEMQANPTEPAKDEMWFEDSPVALSEIEYGKVIKKPTEVANGASPMSELIVPSSTYAHKHGSATQGTRFTYKKRR